MNEYYMTPTPKFSDLMSNPPSAYQVQQILEQHNANTPDTGIKKDSLMAAGLGAGIGLGGISASRYLEGKDKHLNRVERIYDVYNKRHLMPHKKILESKLQRTLRPADAAYAQKALESKTNKIVDYVAKKTNPAHVRSMGLTHLKRTPVSQLLGYGAGGAALGVLANALLSKLQNQG